MAKKNLGRLAGLAALAGAAYMASKGKDKGEDSNPTRAARPESTETRLESPEDTIKRSMKKSDGDSKPITEADVVMPEKAAPKKATPPRSSTTAKTAPRGDSSRSNLEAGMSRGTRATVTPPSASTPSTPSTPSTVSSSAEGMQNYKPRAASPAPAPAAKPTAAPASTGSGRVPTSEQAAANRQAAMDKVKSVGSSVADYVKNFETPAERRSREAKEDSGMKRGGKVKKMASGGMTASRRADGIASRGKTKCKMY
jgi:hypothetical protein